MNPGAKSCLSGYLQQIGPGLKGRPARTNGGRQAGVSIQPCRQALPVWSSAAASRRTRRVEAEAEGPLTKRGCCTDTTRPHCETLRDRTRVYCWTSNAAQRQQRPKPRCRIFRRLFGGAETEPSEAHGAEDDYVADEDLPFPASLLDGTHLQGETSTGLRVSQSVQPYGTPAGPSAPGGCSP